jgi:hypothetical protein
MQLVTKAPHIAGGTPIWERIVAWQFRSGTNAGGCWLWGGSLNKGAYGTVGVDGKTRMLHVVAYSMSILTALYLMATNWTTSVVFVAVGTQTTWSRGRQPAGSDQFHKSSWA